MKAVRFTIMLLLALGVGVALANTGNAPAAPPGAGAKGYVWNKMTREQAEILKLQGDVERGKEAFRACRGCHKADGNGVLDGTYPRLTGQHAVVIIKQVTDTRAGLRSNQKMLPFATDHAVSSQEVADIALYLSQVQSESPTGKGPGTKADLGKKVYLEHQCESCHGLDGQGDRDKVYPAIAAQHYNYLVREMQYIRVGTRANSHPDMVKVIKKISQSDMEAVADYLSRLPDYRKAASTGNPK